MTVTRTARLPRLRATLAAAATVALASLAAAPAGAQAWYYPSFQVPRVVDRDYNFAVVANGGTAALFQWREGLAPDAQLSLDVGLADLNGGTALFLGGNYGFELTRSTREQPLDLLLTAGAGLSAGDGPDLFRIPVGVSVGHRFVGEGGVAVTPYVHPRLSLDVLTGRRPEGVRRTDLTIDFDLGANVELTPRIALRGSLLVTGADGPDNVGFGIGLTYTPAGLRP